MAENKKSVLLYCDIINTVEELSNEEAGVLFKHYLRYINDLNPDPPDKLTKIVFEPIKQTLKRDLKKWEEKLHSKSIAGKAGASARWHNMANDGKRINDMAKMAVIDKVIVKDNVIVKDKVIDSNIPPSPENNLPEVRRIEECLTIAMADQRWVKANKTETTELLLFNDYMERLGHYTFNPLDYKRYFAKLKGRYPEMLKKKYSRDELYEIAKQMDLQNQNKAS